MMKIDAEKFLAMTVLLATTAGAPGCGKKETKVDAKTEAKAVPAAPVAPAPVTPTPVPAATPPVAAPEAVPPAADSGAAAGGGGAAAKPDPGPEEEKPSW